MAKYCKVTNTTTQICSTTVQTEYYRTIPMLPGEEVYIRDELCNKAGFAALGFLVEDAGEFPTTEPAFGEAHDRIVNAIYEERVEATSWFPQLGWPTWESVGFEFPPGTIFESSSVHDSLIPGDPIDVEIQFRQQIQNCVRDPDGTTNSQWKVLPRDENDLATLEDIQDAIDGIVVTGAESPKYINNFLAVDFVGGVFSVPATTHLIPHTPGVPFEVEVFSTMGEKLWVCTATNPVTGEVTVTTDGVTFPGSIIISES